MTKYLFTADEKKKRRRKRPKKKKETSPTSPTSPTTQQAQSPISPNGHTTSTSSTQTSPTQSVHPSSTIGVSTFSGSSISLVQQPAPTIAQSARAYIASKSLDAAEFKGKTKTKTRAGHPSISPEQPPPKEKEKKKRFFSHFTRKKNKEGGKDEEENEGDGDGDGDEDGERKKKKKEKETFRTGVKPKLYLPSKAASLIGRVLGGKADEKKGQAGMKWEHFVKVCLFFDLSRSLHASANGEIITLLGDEVTWVS